MTKKETTSRLYLLRNIPADLWGKVKVRAAQRHESIRAVLLQALEIYVVVANPDSPKDLINKTHHVTWDAPDRRAQLASAVCGVRVTQLEQSDHPTCPDCQEWLARYDSLELGGNDHEQ